jgi:hypothetical protein
MAQAIGVRTVTEDRHGVVRVLYDEKDRFWLERDKAASAIDLKQGLHATDTAYQLEPIAGDGGTYSVVAWVGGYKLSVGYVARDSLGGMMSRWGASSSYDARPDLIWWHADNRFVAAALMIMGITDWLNEQERLSKEAGVS